eukprot:g10678.t1
MGAVTVGFLLWTATKQRCLSRAAQATRRATLRLRILYSSSFCIGSASVIFFIAAALGNLYGTGMLQALYCITIPLAAKGCGHVLEFWVDTLPSQLLPANSVAIKVMKLAEEKGVFVWVGRVGSVLLAALGILAFFFLDATTAVRCINLTTVVITVNAIALYIFVGLHLTGIINNAKHQRWWASSHN